MSDYKFIRVKPEVHKMIKDLAEREGRHITKMLELAVENFEYCVCKNDYEDYGNTTKEK